MEHSFVPVAKLLSSVLTNAIILTQLFLLDNALHRLREKQQFFSYLSFSETVSFHGASFRTDFS